MSNPEAYTVGWICAILAEYVAAQEFLDEEHQPPMFVQPHDQNNYALGRIGQHNVVIATLPVGEYGTASAARAAANMLGSFPNVRIGLMVGIGGGAPSKEHDIRLGDIVVSSPRDGETGVFQYDYGKTIQGQAFQHTRILNQSPVFLRTAVTGMQAQYKRKGHQLQQAIDAILAKNPRLQEEFQRPKPSTDRLFRAKVTHDPKRSTQELANDASNLVPRPERTKNEDNPAIHYGTIASANQLMKNAIIRDKLAAKNNVLCFEMEAAGLMNHFPCLVIRGICDYSDSHKNKDWQGYAAMAAAAYAKDLLRTIPLNTIEAEQTVMDRVEANLKVMGKNVEKLQTRVDKKENDDILDWLADNYHGCQQSRFREMRYKDTGRWFLRSTEFQKWKDGGGQILFCPGVPGVGKTMITSIVIDHLLSAQQDTNIGIAFLYLDYAEQQEQDIDNLLAGLLRQLANSADAVEDCVKAMFDKRNENPIPTQKGLSDALKLVMDKFQATFLIVDALDECHSPKCRKDLMSTLFSFQSRHEVNIFVTSRPDPKITKLFQGSLSKNIIAPVEDLDRYLTGQLPDVYQHSTGEHRQLLDEAKSDILEAADGTFLIARLYLNLLHDMDVSSVEELRQALCELRGDRGRHHEQRSELLKNTYAKTMNRIQCRSGNLAMQALLLVSCAKEQITSCELQDALAVAMHQGSAVTESDLNVVPIERILSICLGLVVVHPKTDHVRLVHHTAHEYFTSTREELFPAADAEMTRACIAYLSLYTPPLGDFYSSKLLRWCESHPFYLYATSNWGYHARDASACVELVVEFLRDTAKMRAAARALSHSFYYQHYHSVHAMGGLHLAAYFGLEEVCRRLIQIVLESHVSSQKPTFLVKRALKKMVNEKITEFSMTPLHYAVLGGYESIVRLLLEHSADVNAVALTDVTPLSIAYTKRYDSIAKLLKKHGAEFERIAAKEFPWFLAMAIFPSRMQEIHFRRMRRRIVLEEEFLKTYG